MKKGFMKQAVRYFAVVLIIPTLISCGSSGGSNSEKDPATPSSLSNETPPATPASTGEQPSTDPGATSTATAVPVADPAPETDPVTEDAGGGPSDGDARWQALGARVNAAQRGVAVWLTLATIENAPVVSWEEDGKIYTGFWNGTRMGRGRPLECESE
ncbi:MAG: hypothetical protein MPW15_22680 [Candidatus Manganitrophus sp.]|nr:hypothetical protein [Candidatus Manganitrophus sp.]